MQQVKAKMQKIPYFWGIYAQPGKILTKVLNLLPVALIIGGYLTVSHYRHIENPNDKLIPTPQVMFQEMKEIITVPDKRSGEILFWTDTKASLSRLAIGVSIASIGGYLLGIFMGIFPGFRALFGPVITGLSNINPLALLVIILVTFGVGELSKIFLIVFGIGIPIARSIEQAVGKIPKELIVKSCTLGASQFEVIARVIAPQMFPKLVELCKVSLGSAWIFVIAAEAVASTEGLGYRIYLQQRYMNMGLIIPYVLYIALIAYVTDIMLQLTLNKMFPWYNKVK